MTNDRPTKQEGADYLEVNRKAWNDRTGIHWESDFYNNDRFIDGETSLKSVELDLLGDVSQKDVLHLQCHFGQDSISLARMGAEVTGLDLSDAAIERAKELNERCQTDCRFVNGDVYSTPDLIHDRFDIVFTSYGTIGWLPDLDRWAKVISTMLKPGGRFVMVDFHPMVWMWDDEFQRIEHRYFKSEPIVETANGTYADRDADIQRTEVSWNHGLAEIITALLENGLALESMGEYDWSAYDCFIGLAEIAPGRFRTSRHGDRLPMMYSIAAVKK